jgi:NitT/TauT family transport system permease protein
VTFGGTVPGGGEPTARRAVAVLDGTLPDGPEPAGPAPPPGARRSRVGALAAAVWPPTLFLGVVVGAWYLLRYAVLSERRKVLLPPPQEVWDKAFADDTVRSALLHGLQATAKESFVGFAIAAALGMLFGILMSQAKWIERSFFPWAILLQTVPILALIPLIRLWFGFEFKARVIVAVIISLFPIITNTLFGLLSTDEGHHDLFTLHGAGRWTRLWKLELPGALPAVFTGFRISAGLSVIGAVVGEYFFRQGDRGLGQLIDGYRRGLRLAEMFGAVFWACALGVFAFLLFTWLGNLVTRSWYSASLREQ